MKFFRLVALSTAISVLSLSNCSSNKTTADATPIKSAPTPSPTPSSFKFPSPLPKTLGEAATTLARLDNNAANYSSYLGYLKRLDQHCNNSPAQLVKLSYLTVYMLADGGKKVSHLKVISSAVEDSTFKGYKGNGHDCTEVFVSVMMPDTITVPQ